MDIAQDARKGSDRSVPELWEHIAQEYKQRLPAHISTNRPWRSLQTRWANISIAVSKLRGCIQQIEKMNPSGASEQDILDRAKELLRQDPKYKKGFKFDHVWHIVKDMHKFCKTRSSLNVRGRKRTMEGSQPQSLGTEKSIDSCSFAVDLNDDFETDDHCNEMNNVDECPTRRKKEQMKKQLSDEHNQFISAMEHAMEQQTAQFKGMFEHNPELLQKQYELDLFKAQTAAKKVALAKEKLALAKRKEENKILITNLNLIEDPTVREFIRRQQLQIVAERNQEHGG